MRRNKAHGQSGGVYASACGQGGLGREHAFLTAMSNCSRRAGSTEMAAAIRQAGMEEDAHDLWST